MSQLLPTREARNVEARICLKRLQTPMAKMA